MNEEAALRLLYDEIFDGREGCFCLTSSRNMDASYTLRVYRSRDAVEKLFHSLKNEIEVNRFACGPTTPCTASCSQVSSLN